MSGPVLVFLATLCWGALHSVLASPTAKAAARKRWGRTADRFYRLGFNVMTILTLLPLLAVLVRNIGPVIYRVPWPWWALVEAVQLIALALLAVSFLRSDPAYFLGLRQSGREETSGRLVVTGPYAVVRHPMYTIGLIVLWCFPILTAGTLAFALGITLYILAGSEFEERKLIALYGDEYRNYQRRVARLIPFIF
jgi:protein-S-isoprenylcysteine O-methyltransferase Ste14